MSFVHALRPCEPITNRVLGLTDRLRGSRWALAFGLGGSALAGTSLAPLSLAGPVVAALAAGSLGGRAAASVGFVAYVVTEQPGLGTTVAAGAFAALLGWGVPRLLDEVRRAIDGTCGDASAIVVDCAGFDALDETYGDGTGDHVFGLLQRAMRMEVRDGDLVVCAQDRELILATDEVSPETAERVMARVERRFAAWLSDAGYECDLRVGVTGIEETLRLPSLGRVGRNGPYLD